MEERAVRQRLSAVAFVRVGEGHGRDPVPAAPDVQSLGPLAGDGVYSSSGGSGGVASRLSAATAPAVASTT